MPWAATTAGANRLDFSKSRRDKVFILPPMIDSESGIRVQRLRSPWNFHLDNILKHPL
jgi:hypothetical protein